MMRGLAVIALALVLTTACTEEVIFDFEENLQEELLVIDQFLNENQIPFQQLDNGIRYRFLAEGSGASIDLKDTVRSFYAVYLLDSTLIDSNIREVLDANGATNRGSEVLTDVIETGLDDNWRYQFYNEAYKLSKEGTRLQLFIPSYLAFGTYTRTWGFVNEVPGNTPVMFEVEVTDLIKVD